MYAEVIIPLALPKNYTWLIPEKFLPILQVGMRVEVGLGKQKKYAGIVKRIHDEKPTAFEPKELLNVLDASPVLHLAQLQLWEWMATYYMCSEGEVMAAALPAHFKLSSESILVYNEEAGEDLSALDNDEYLVGEALQIRKELRLSEVQQILDVAHVYPVIKRLLDKKICFVWESLKETYVPRKESFVRLHPDFSDEEKLAALLNNWSRAPKQLELLLAYLHFIRTDGIVTKKALLEKSGANDAQLKGLVDKGILILEKREVDRIAYLPQELHIDFTLSQLQEKALHAIEVAFKEKDVCLLQGVTGSGKTEIYIRLIAEQIKKGGQVLYLLPEIALTAQIIRRLQKHFGGYIGIYHSKFSQNERIEIWNKVKSGELKAVLGARSALFLPFKNLQLVVVDEEHDTSYKQQDPAPRYHARDAAIYYAGAVGAKVLLGSATPSVESRFNAFQSKYGFVSLMERYGGVSLPEIEIVDTKPQMLKEKTKVMISEALQLAITQALADQKQIILFQNRRGYLPFQICKACGWIPQCRHCDVKLTYHKFSHKLHCHYCGTVYTPLVHCEACGSHDFSQQSFGTEKIEEYLQDLFPAAKVARMDLDTVRGKHAHETMIQQFEQQRIDILVGTQMVVKGLDFEHVSLVGILDGDSLLSFADFRVNERAFQLMEQVSGRAGRKDGKGKVIIQVMNTRHPVLPLVQQHDYQQFFEKEIEARRTFVYPPFSRLIKLTFRHKNKDIVEGAARFFAAQLKPQLGSYMVGPAAPVVNRIRNQYLMELLFKIPKAALGIQQTRDAILHQIAILHQQPAFKSAVVVPDVDPL
ncbi:MAG: primosomal protein N' [Bacteroidetes bacterium]|nr:primosomal protein N' [Bacteroidota bacterium]